MAPARETENNAYAKFWGVKQRALRYVQLSTKRTSVSVESQKLQHSRSVVFLGAINNLNKAYLAKDNLTTGLVTTVRDHVRCSKSEGESDLIDRFLIMLRNGAF